MAIRFKRVHQHPWVNVIVAYEFEGDCVRWAGEKLSREFLHEVIERYGAVAVRTLFANLKTELARRVESGDCESAQVTDAIAWPEFRTRSHEEWTALIGVAERG